MTKSSIRNNILWFFILIHFNLWSQDSFTPFISSNINESTTDNKITVFIEFNREINFESFTVEDLSLTNSSAENLRTISNLQLVAEYDTVSVVNYEIDHDYNQYLLKDDTLIVIDYNGDIKLVHVIQEIENPRIIRVDTNLNFYIGDPRADKIWVFDSLGTPKYELPTQLHLSTFSVNNDSIYVGGGQSDSNDHGNYIYVFDTLGTLHDTIDINNAGGNGTIETIRFQGDSMIVLFNYYFQKQLGEDVGKVILLDSEQSRNCYVDNDNNFYLLTSSGIRVYSDQLELDLHYDFKEADLAKGQRSEYVFPNYENHISIISRNYSLEYHLLNDKVFVDIIPMDEGEVEVYLDSNRVSDFQGNLNLKSNIHTFYYGSLGPNVNFDLVGDYATDDPFLIRISDFNSTQGFDISDMKILGATIEGLKKEWVNLRLASYLLNIQPDKTRDTIVFEIEEGKFTSLTGIPNRYVKYEFPVSTAVAWIAEKNIYTEVDSLPIEIGFNMSRMPSNFSIESLTINNAELVGFDNQGLSIQVRILPTMEDGIIELFLPKDVLTDTAGYGNFSSSYELIYDLNTPTAYITSPDEGFSKENYVVQLQLSENVPQFETNLISVEGGQVLDGINFIHDVYQFTVKPDDGSENISVWIDENSFQDFALRGNLPVTFQLKVDPDPLSFALSLEKDVYNSFDPIILEIRTSEPVENIDSKDFNCFNCSTKRFEAITEQLFKVELIPDSEGLIGANIPQSSFTNLQGLYNLESEWKEAYFDGTSPIPDFNISEPEPVYSDEVTLSISLSEPVLSFEFDPITCIINNDICFNIDDLSVTGGSVVDFRGADDAFEIDLFLDNDEVNVLVTILPFTLYDWIGNTNLEEYRFEFVNGNGVLSLKDHKIHQNINVSGKVMTYFNDRREDVTIRIFDLNGRLLTYGMGDDQEIFLDMSELPPSLYVGVIKNGEQLHRIKFLLK